MSVSSRTAVVTSHRPPNTRNESEQLPRADTPAPTFSFCVVGDAQTPAVTVSAISVSRILFVSASAVNGFSMSDAARERDEEYAARHD